MSGSPFENLQVSRKGAVLLVTLDRPRKYNALDSATLDELGRTFHEAGEDPDVGAVVLTGSPEARRPAFAAGADIQEMAGMDVLALRRYGRRGQEVLAAIEGLGRPVIAAVNGLALGGGCELALACHIRYASREASFGQPEINLGLITGFGGSQRLPRLVGRGPALEMLLTGDPVDAERARDLGLVNRVLEPDKLLDAALELGGNLASKAPVARELLLDVVNRGASMDFEQAQRLEADLFGMLASTADTKEGLAAFLEKRSPRWQGR